MKRMLINASHKEELRIALINNKKLYDLNIENKKYKKKISNIYKGKISRLEPSLEAVFINYGDIKNGFLPLKEISSKYFKKNKKNIKNIKNLYKGQELIIQITKDSIGKKGATLTTFINLIGSYLILMPNKKKKFGISKKIEGKERKNIKIIIKKLKIPKNMGLIIRTAGLGKSIKIFKLELSLILKNWKNIKKKFKKEKNPILIYKQNNIFIKIFRDHLNKDIKEIIIDNYKIYKLSIKNIKLLRKLDFIDKIKFYNKEIPLFSYFKIESQIESAFKRKVKLPSGGSIIIDNTEALISIDINSSKYNKANNIEITAFNTNLEAIKEISKQLILRNLGGLIVIDFIDMNITNTKIIENKFKKIINKDKAKTKIGYISQFGLLEMSRQRLNLSLKESNYYICPRCKGNGILRNNESLSLLILRIIQEKSLKKNTKEIHITVPINIAYYLLKKKNFFFHNIKKKNIKIIIIPNKKIKTPNYSILRIKHKIKINNYIKIKNKFNNLYINKQLIYKNYKFNFFKKIHKLIKNILIIIKNIKYFIYNRIIYKNNKTFIYNKNNKI